MSTARDRIPEQALERHDPGELTPSRGGPVLLGLEVLPYNTPLRADESYR